jgi:hypothetical protein
MYLLSSLMIVGLLLATDPPATEWPWQIGDSVPAVFIFPGRDAATLAVPGHSALPPWLQSRELNI